MKEIMIFGRNFTVLKQKSDIDSLEQKDDQIIIQNNRKPSNTLLKERLTDLLYSQLCKIYDQIQKEGKIEVFGNLDFEIVDNIDNKKERVAKLKGNKILVKLNAVGLPREALRYLIVHEIGHTFTKRHTNRFWKIVKTMYPNFKTGKNLLLKYQEVLKRPWSPG